MVTEVQREVYFIRARALGLVKIGVANNALKRVRELAMVSPDQLQVLGVMICRSRGALETQLHAAFSRQRSHGEWFHPSAELLNWIELNGTINDRRIARLQAACDDPMKPKGRRPRTLQEHAL